MKTKTVYCCLLLFPLVESHDAIGQSVRRPLAADYVTAGAYTEKHTDAFSFVANPASLTQLKETAAGVYGERRYMLKEISNYTIGIAMPTASGNFGIKANYYGFSDYGEMQAGLAYGRKIGKQLAAGVQFNYYTIKAAGYGSTSAVSFDAGLILHVTGKLHTGIYVSNPVAGKFGKVGMEKLAAVYSVGLGYDASEVFFFTLVIEKEESQPVNVCAALQYKIIPRIVVRAGVASGTSSVWAGAGFILKSLRIDITSAFHPQLGFTPGLLLLISLSKKER